MIADYISRYADGFEELQKRLPKYTPQQVSQWTGIPVDDIERLAHEYATQRPAVIRVNYGIQRTHQWRRGGASGLHVARDHGIMERSWRRLAALAERRFWFEYRFDWSAPT